MDNIEAILITLIQTDEDNPEFDKLLEIAAAAAQEGDKMLKVKVSYKGLVLGVITIPRNEVRRIEAEGFILSPS